jgi:hypothetical protein
MSPDTKSFMFYSRSSTNFDINAFVALTFLKNISALHINFPLVMVVNVEAL